MNIKFAVCLLSLALPEQLRYAVFRRYFGWKIDPSAKISRFSVLIVDYADIGKDASIGALTVIRGLSNLRMGTNSIIGRLNWISGYPAQLKQSFSQIGNRDPSLYIGDESAITNRHLIDCTDAVRIGRYSTVAGFRSQVLTHSINLESSMQSCAPVLIGDYVFVGTAVVILGGSTIPSYTVVGANTLINKELKEQYCLYGGVPVKQIKTLPHNYKYFSRESGSVS